MSNVYICNYAGYDYAAARKYGKLKSVTKGTVNIFKINRLAFDVKQALDEFDPEEDYLLFGGNILINVIAVNEILSRSETVKCLIYGAKKQDYVELIIRKNWPSFAEDDEEIIDLSGDVDSGYEPPKPELLNHTLSKRRKPNGGNY